MRKRLLVIGVALCAALAMAVAVGCSSGGGSAPAGGGDTSSSAAAAAPAPAAETSAEAAPAGDSQKITIAGTAVSQVFYEALKDKYESQGYETEFIIFDSNPVCLEACASGDTMISLGQQKKFMQSYNDNNGANLDMVHPYGMFTGIGLYSEKYSSVDEFPDGAQIAVMNDPTNEDVSLKVLQSAGLTKLADDIEFATKADIVENPKNLDIVEMEQAQTPTALEDMAGACCWFTHMSAAGKDPASFLVRDNVMVNYPMGVIVKGEDATSDWAVAFAECLRDPDVQAKIAETYPNVFEFYTDDSQVQE